MVERKRTKRRRPRKQVDQEVPDWVPPFTTSLDAAIPDENIESVQYEEASGKWIAVNKDDGRLYIGVGNTEPLARRIAALKAVDARQNRGDAVPAAGRFVGLNHNSREFKELIVTLDRLTEAIQESNEYAASHPDDRERRLSELSAARDLLTRPGPVGVAAVAMVVSTLSYLGMKFADALIGNLADAALELLQRVLGG